MGDTGTGSSSEPLLGPSSRNPLLPGTVTCQKTVDASVWLGNRRPTTCKRERQESLDQANETPCTFAKKNDTATNKSKLDL